jgi:hypothetical protein
MTTPRVLRGNSSDAMTIHAIKSDDGTNEVHAGDISLPAGAAAYTATETIEAWLEQLASYNQFGTADPSAGAGVAAPIGATYRRNNSGAGELWFKTAAGATAWTRVTVP